MAAGARPWLLVHLTTKQHFKRIIYCIFETQSTTPYWESIYNWVRNSITKPILQYVENWFEKPGLPVSEQSLWPQLCLPVEGGDRLAPQLCLQVQGGDRLAPQLCLTVQGGGRLAPKHCLPVQGGGRLAPQTLSYSTGRR